MASANNRMSTYTQVSTSSDHDGPKSSDAKKDLWLSMLDGVASGKRLPEKNILVLGMQLSLSRRATLANISIGGTTDSQKEFLEALSVDDLRKTQDRQRSKQPPIANNFALGYTYHDVLDADHEGMDHCMGIGMELC
jgi:dynein light intermediate chain 1